MNNLIFLILIVFNLQAFDKVVVWGHKYNNNTFFYVNNAFVKTFKHLGYDTYWFDNEDQPKDFDFSNSLFLVEGQVDQDIPIRDDCKYVIHNCEAKKYSSLSPKNWMILQVYTDDVLTRPSAEKVEPCIHFDIVNKTLYMPWATDLLPLEIDVQKEKLKYVKKGNKIYWIGTIGAGEFGNVEEIDPFVDAATKSGVEFVALHPGQATTEQNAILIMKAYMAPTIVGPWQKSKGYIPCRIFKNISYGAMGITNSYRVYELFQKNIVFNSDPYQLFFDAQEKLPAYTLEKAWKMMDFVKNHHTYLNRIDRILQFLELVESTN